MFIPDSNGSDESSEEQSVTAWDKELGSLMGMDKDN